MADLIDFQPYLKSLLPDPPNKDWGDRYTPTEAKLPLKVQTVVPYQDDLTQRQQEAPKRYEVLAGLREYAAGHVVLVGKPGSGKSTALQRLRWEEAQVALDAIEDGHTDFTIPVLIELRDRREGPVVNWIQRVLRRVRLDEGAIEDLLLDGRFLLLFDGLNEIPSSEMWSTLDEFQRDRDFYTNPRIFTTRELGAGSDLSIEKKLEMLPLTEPQMREFIQKRLPGRADSLLRQLQGRLRELAETPLLLQMLCDVVAESPAGQIPQNRGELFRQEFARRYEAFKPLRGRVSEDSRRFAPELLQHLAFVMTQGEPHTDPLNPTPSWLTISKAQAETILETYLTGRVEAPAKAGKEWLEDLLEFHPLQVGSNSNQVEFHHQLFQEYYAAEALLQKLPALSNIELKQNYFNYLKWTEVVALTLGMVEQESQAVDFVQLALDVDLKLGARLAGEVKQAFQTKTVEIINQLPVPTSLKVVFLGSTHSESAVSGLIPILNDEYLSHHWFATYALSEIGGAEAVGILISELNDEYYSIRWSAATALSRIANEAAIISLIETLNDEEFYVRWTAAEALLGRVSNETVITVFIDALKVEDSSVRLRAAEVLSEIGAEMAVVHLIDTLEDNVPDVRQKAAEALVKINVEAAVTALIESLTHCGGRVSGKISSRKAVEALRDALIRSGVDIARIDGHTAVSTLISALSHKDVVVRRKATVVSGAIGGEIVVTALTKALEDEDRFVRYWAVKTLGKVGSKKALAILIHALNHRYRDVCRASAEALGKFGGEKAFSTLIAALNDEHYGVRESAAEALGKIGDEKTVNALTEVLKDKLVKRSAAEALGKIGGEAAVKSLIAVLTHPDPDLHLIAIAADALGRIGDAKHLPILWPLQLNTTETDIYNAILAIQARCGIYNYEIAQAAVEEGKRVKSERDGNEKDATYSIKAEVVQIIEKNDGTVIGQFLPKTE
jgi:HEAT repeat protein